jgi:alpha-L-fucosidase
MNRRSFVAAGVSALVARPLLAAQPSRSPAAVQSTSAVGAVGRYASPVPTAAQLAWQRDERALFLHFGVNTFTDKEWGDGAENPLLFNPTKLDARQWARTAKECGFPAMLLTAKHHDGFCLWPTKTTSFSVSSSAWKDGQGDVVREFVDACKAEGIKPGFFCSALDRNSPLFGDSPKYNALYHAQLTELLTQYGDFHQLWFDGANGVGQNGDPQIFDWPATFSLVRKLQPNAIIYSDAGPDARWIGNDRGDPSMANWSRFDPTAVPLPGAEGPRVNISLQSGHANGTVWRPGETDVSIRPTWYHHASEDRRVKSAPELVSYYFASVGRNSKLLLNVPPNREGLISDKDTLALATMHKTLTELFQDDVTRGLKQTWTQSDRNAVLEIDFEKPTNVSLIDLREDIARGQSVARYVTEGFADAEWKELSKGTTIGYRALDRFQQTQITRLRVRIEEFVDTLHPITVRAFSDPVVSAGVKRGL